METEIKVGDIVQAVTKRRKMFGNGIVVAVGKPGMRPTIVVFPAKDKPFEIYPLKEEWVNHIEVSPEESKSIIHAGWVYRQMMKELNRA